MNPDLAIKHLATSTAALNTAAEHTRQALEALRGTEPPWYLIARAEIGVREIVGAQHDPRVLEYLATCHREHGGNLGNYAAERDETPWCSAFVNFCVERAGLEGTRSAWARSWLDWGQPCGPVLGAIAVLERGQHSGHVAFLDGLDRGPRGALQVPLLGGNQSNAVNVSSYAHARVLGYRWPAGLPIPAELPAP